MLPNGPQAVSDGPSPGQPAADPDRPNGDAATPVPEVSVIVLGYNGRRYVDRCLRSLDAQSPGGPTFEVIFFDNASTDGTPELVAGSYSWVRLVRSPRNLGFAAGNVAALPHARARHVAFVNQDTYLGHRWVAGLLGTLRASGAAIVQSSMILPWQPCASTFDPSAQHADLHVAELTPAAYVGYRVLPGQPWLPTLFVTGAGFMIDRSVLPEVGGLFDPDFWAYCEDTDLALRTRSVGLGAAVSRDAVMLHDLTPTTGVGSAAIRKTLRILRNRYLACYRSMAGIEFLMILPALVIGGIGKAGELPVTGRKVILQVGMLGLSLLALVWAIVSMPRHRGARRATLDRRARGSESISAAIRRAEARLLAAASTAEGGTGTRS
jgi:GT2 family glycosyltransferase